MNDCIIIFTRDKRAIIYFFNLYYSATIFITLQNIIFIIISIYHTILFIWASTNNYFSFVIKKQFTDLNLLFYFLEQFFFNNIDNCNNIFSSNYDSIVIYIFDTSNRCWYQKKKTLWYDNNFQRITMLSSVDINHFFNLI